MPDATSATSQAASASLVASNLISTGRSWKRSATNRSTNSPVALLATGKTRSIREFAEATFAELDIDLQWEGEGEDEVAIDKKTGKTVIRIDPLYFRPTEVDLLVGDYSKAKNDFGWEPEISFEKMVSDMVSRDLLLAQHEPVSPIIT